MPPELLSETRGPQLPAVATQVAGLPVESALIEAEMVPGGSRWSASRAELAPGDLQMVLVPNNMAVEAAEMAPVLTDVHSIGRP